MKILAPDMLSELVVHLAIRAYDLESTLKFYTDVIGATSFRTMDDRITLGLGNLQLVCHLTMKIDSTKPKFYPNHFGFTFRNIDAYQQYYDRIHTSHAKHLFKVDNIRFKARDDQHRTFIMLDPSDNFIEVKCYAKTSNYF
jgi:uncharacterized protein